MAVATRPRKRTTSTGYPAPHAFVTINGYDCERCPLRRGNTVHDSTEDHLLEEPPPGYVA